jgi:hypothetical protein
MRKIYESDSRLVGHSISFIDIDETTFHTFANVHVMNGKALIRKLNNKEFNTYKLKPGEHYDFQEFADSDVFNKTSQPIAPTIERIKNMINSIKRYGKMDKIIFLTARTDFNDKELFLKTFRQNGIDVDLQNVYVERSGNLKDIDNVADRKRYIMLKYLQTGLYTAVRMMDDDMKNLQTFIKLGDEVNSGKFHILDNVRKNFPNARKIFFFPLLVNDDGKITRL